MSNFKVFSRINVKSRKLVILFAAIVFIISSIVTITAIKQPLFIEEKFINNTIEEKTSYEYFAAVKPSTLYPNGGVVIPDKAIFNNLTDEFIIKLNSELNSVQPVRIDATKEVTYSIIAEDMWEREYISIPSSPIKIEGLSHNLIQNEVHINLKDIYGILNKVEEETLVRANYILKINNKITGKVYDGEKVIYEINNKLEIPFNISGQYIEYKKEKGEKEERQFIKTNVIEDIKTVPQTFKLMGIKLSIQGARFGFGIISIIFLILIIIYFIEAIKAKKEQLTAADKIESKHKGKIVVISDKIDLQIMPNIALDRFKDLLKISEDKEEAIFKYTDNANGITYYYIASASFIYFYSCLNNIEGSELTQDA